MQPTLGAELAGARRALAAVVAEHDLSADAVADVEEVIRLLRRIETTWSRVLPHLAADNARIERLLTRLVPLVPDDVRPGLVAALNTPVDAEMVDTELLNARNEQLRELLCQVIASSPADSGGATATVRALVVACLKEGLDGRPW